MHRRPLSLAMLLVFAGGCYTGLDAGQDTDITAGPGGSGGETGGTAPTTSAGESGDTGEPDAAFEPAPVRLRLLLARHYRNAIRDLLGEAAAAQATPPVDTALNGFEAIAAAQVALGDAAVEQYEKSGLSLIHI